MAMGLGMLGGGIPMMLKPNEPIKGEPAYEISVQPPGLMLVAGGLSLGLAIQETGLAEYYVGKLSGFDLNLYALMATFSILTIVFSNFMSNTATTTILIPIAIILVSNNTVILPLVIGLSASTALFLPISTPPNAIAFSTGKLDQKDFRYVGIIAGLLGPAIIIGIVLLIGSMYS